MSIRRRLEDARLLSKAGSQDGAFILVLIAAAATSRKRYKRTEHRDGDAFKNFIYDELRVITGHATYEVALPFQGKTTPLEDILYHHLRCQLVHEGEMPVSVIFTQSIRQESEVANMLHLGTPLGFPAGWIERLATAVWLAPENDELWIDESEKRKKARDELGELQHDGLDCRRPPKSKKESDSFQRTPPSVSRSPRHPVKNQSQQFGTAG